MCQNIGLSTPFSFKTSLTFFIKFAKFEILLSLSTTKFAQKKGFLAL